VLPPLTVFDVETTGLDPRRGHRIIEIAAVHVAGGVIEAENAFHAFVDPEREIPPEAKQIHKISASVLKNAPTIDQVLPRFLAFAGGSPIVAHNCEFDRSFLACEKEHCWGYVDLPECLCTMLLSRRLFPHEFRHSLDVVALRLGLTLPPERHRSLPDVLLTAQSLLKMIEKGNIHSLDELRILAALRQFTAK